MASARAVPVDTATALAPPEIPARPAPEETTTLPSVTVAARSSSASIRSASAALTAARSSPAAPTWLKVLDPICRLIVAPACTPRPARSMLRASAAPVPAALTAEAASATAGTSADSDSDSPSAPLTYSRFESPALAR